jgi:hypothetical protein
MEVARRCRFQQPPVVCLSKAQAFSPALCSHTPAVFVRLGYKSSYFISIQKTSKIKFFYLRDTMTEVLN